MENSNSSNGRKILIVTDAWDQVNGVVTTLTNVVKQLTDMDHEVKVLSHVDCALKCKMPLYPEVTLAWVTRKTLENNIFWANAVHISTPEGPVGFRALRFCIKHAIPFTTGYHTKWPEFVRARIPFPESITYRFMKWIHKHSSAVLVPTQTSADELAEKGFDNLYVWTRGVDRNIFRSNLRHPLTHCGHPFMVCVSRVSKEKGLDDFCSLEWSDRHTKVVVGDGPYLEELKEKYPEVIFTGVKKGIELAQFYACADVFVFPSRTDTFGVVMIESMACGTPVAAYPVTGPIDVIEQGVTGCMHYDLKTAVKNAVSLDRTIVQKASEKWTWEECAQQFLDQLKWRN